MEILPRFIRKRAKIYVKQAFYQTDPLTDTLISGKFYVGANFFPFVFRFLTYLLSCILFLFALRYFFNYAPLLRAVCKFRYSLLSRPYLLPVLRIY